ncbi:D-hexose-6-phosphate mutarotase [Cellulomonas aerilata]|uniref:Putative glucose-6-phosphate 1-epimerase n=1 Tax=Cellulomonas aerilata TaxID=515326 RepID=A0A512DAS5_9CELL|nr:D-hexose-6-phosphate mutarotase [Cellulomonas aerilata]GEO33583.1 D-hexose-6-phosphate mutarotase [Cellulomonas aerilata]
MTSADAGTPAGTGSGTGSPAGSGDGDGRVPSGPPDLPASVVLGPGEGGLDRLTVTAPTGRAEIYLQGAHVTRWHPTDAEDVLFLSARSRFADGTAIRGGVPICFPWFGPHPTDATAPSHGFARVLPWRLLGAREAGDDVVVELGLEDSPQTRAGAWPHPFRATYRVTVGATLRLELEVTGTGTGPVTFEEALHTYLAIGDIRTAVVGGLERTAYRDKVAGGEVVQGASEPVRVTGETDRVYLGTRETAVVEDPAGGRSVVVGKDGSATTVLWNPWAEKAAALADLGDDEWTRMVCVETANTGDDAVTLEPGGSHTMTATLAVRLAGPAA